MVRLARISLLVAIVVAVHAGDARAQAPTQLVTFTGKISPADVPATPFCEGAKYVLDCSGAIPGGQTGIPVRSDQLDLSKLVGEVLEYSGGWTPGPCTSLDVFSAAKPVATLVRCGNPVPGCQIRFRVGPSGEIGQWVLYFSAAPAFLPLGEDATLLLSAPQFLASGLLFGDTATYDVSIPPDISLTGVNLWFQGTRQSIGPVGPLRLTNAECLTIWGPSPPCVLLDC